MGLEVGTLTQLTLFFVENKKAPFFTLTTISLFTDVPGAACARAGGRAMSRATCKSSIAWGISHFPRAIFIPGPL
jgi:hypothetical protein